MSEAEEGRERSTTRRQKTIKFYNFLDSLTAGHIRRCSGAKISTAFDKIPLKFE